MNYLSKGLCSRIRAIINGFARDCEEKNNSMNLFHRTNSAKSLSSIIPNADLKYEQHLS